MKEQWRKIAICVVIGCLVAINSWAQQTVEAEFNKLKMLEGSWQGMKSDGQEVEVAYQIMSNGSAVVETLMPKGEPSMVTVYHLDGNRLMMTHYCSAGNQPRMVASTTHDGTIDFQLQSVTNLMSKSDGHMEGLKIMFLDDNHFNQVWTWNEKGNQVASTFEYVRAKG